MNLPAPAPLFPEDLIDFTSQIDDADDRARKLLDGLSESQANWQPGAGAQWSIVQCIEHMALTNRSYLQALQASVSRARPGHTRLQPAGWFSRYFLRKTEPPVSIKIKAPKKIAPAPAIPARTALQNFLDSDDTVRRFARETAALDLCGTRFKNPYVPGLNFTIATGLLIIAAHNRRHLWQAERVRQSSDFPA